MQNLKGMVVRGGFAKLSGRAANVVLRLGVMAALARMLDPQDFGLVAMTVAVTGMFNLLDNSCARQCRATPSRTNRYPRCSGSAYWLERYLGCFAWHLHPLWQNSITNPGCSG